ncbi:MAG: hypothetical protein ACSHW0_06775 [Thalassotalea sp.]
MTNTEQFKRLSKQYAKSFNDQKAIIKKVLAGRIILCQQCQQVITFNEKNKECVQVRCSKGCTDILLDISI